MTTHHILPVRTYLLIYAALMVLLGLTIGAAYLPLAGSMNFIVAMTIATTKAVLVLLYFMHLRYSSKLTMISSFAAFVWLGIMIVLTLSDYLTRDWLSIPGK